MAGQEKGIQWLADEAGVSVRTVRFYVSLGLLDSPEGRGRGAMYTAEHLDRLRLIRSLVEQRVPLKEIQDTMQGLGAPDVRKLVAREGRRSTQEAEARSRSPRDYVSALLERAQSRPASHSPVTMPSEAIPSAPPPPSPPPLAHAHGTWRRIRLAPGVELHVDTSMEETNQALVERILAMQEPTTRRPHGNKQRST